MRKCTWARCINGMTEWPKDECSAECWKNHQWWFINHRALLCLQNPTWICKNQCWLFLLNGCSGCLKAKNPGHKACNGMGQRQSLCILREKGTFHIVMYYKSPMSAEKYHSFKSQCKRWQSLMSQHIFRKIFKIINRWFFELKIGLYIFINDIFAWKMIDIQLKCKKSENLWCKNSGFMKKIW